MKAGTIARIIDVGLMVVIVLALVIPAVVTISENDVSSIGVGIPAVYDKDELNAETLADNIQTATNGEPGYKISYGNQCIDIVQSNVEDICEGVMLSNADTVTILAPDGQIAVQQNIIYSNSAYIMNRTGIMAPGLDSLPVLMNMSLGLKDPDGNLVFSGNSLTESDASGLYMTFYTPILPYIAASSAGYCMSINSSADMTGIFGMDMDIDMPPLDSIPFSFSSAMGVNTLTFDTHLAGNALGSMGDVKMASSSLNGFTLVYTGVLSEKLDSMADEGTVDILMGDKTYTMSQDDAHGLADIFRVLEAGA